MEAFGNRADLILYQCKPNFSSFSQNLADFFSSFPTILPLICALPFPPFPPQAPNSCSFLHFLVTSVPQSLNTFPKKLTKMFS